MKEFDRGFNSSLEAFRTFDKHGHHHNAELAGRDVLRAIRRGLDHLSVKQLSALIDDGRCVIGELDRLEGVREALVALVKRAFETHSPEVFLEVLPRIEAALPTSRKLILVPTRRAAEVRLGKAPSSLPGETEEMRRVVREFLDQSDLSVS